MMNVMKQLFKIIHSRSQRGWIVVDKNYKIIYTNEAISKLCKKSPNQLVNQSLLDLFHGGSKTDAFGNYCGVLVETLETKHELRAVQVCGSAVKEGGGKTWYSADTYLFHDPDNQEVYAAGNYCIIDKFKDTEQQLENINLSIIKAFCRVMGSKDAYTIRHEENVADLLLGFSTYLNFPEDEIQKKIYLTGIVHDIGKVAIPETVLNKPGRLTAAEFAVIKQHPVIGSDILYEIEGFEEIADIVRHHHERFDGQGYPDGLEGEAIPLYSRVLSVCDAFDAMTSVRCYRDTPLNIDHALTEIERCSATQFDPAVCEQFIEYVRQKTSY